jgi:hypothetical protein
MTRAPSPEDVAESYLTALGNRDWDAAAALVDEDLVNRTLAAFLEVSEEGEGAAVPREHGEDGTSHVFHGVQSRAELAGMSAFDAYARLLATFGTGSYASAGPRQLEKIVGSIVQGDIAHVVYYSKWEPETESLPWVLALQRGRRGWAVLPTGAALEPVPETLFVDPLRLDW